MAIFAGIYHNKYLLMPFRQQVLWQNFMISFLKVMNLAQPLAQIFTLFGLTVNQHTFSIVRLSETKKMKLFFVLTIGSIHGLPYPKFEWEEVYKFSKISDSNLALFAKLDISHPLP